MYVHHFGLRAEPFSLTPDPAFLYRSPGHSEALAALEIGLRGRRGFMVMTGEVGTGKTTLLYSLLSELGSEIRTAYVSNTKLSFDQMLQQALVDFGVPSPVGDRLGQLTALNAFLHSCATDGVTAALVIDEAQNLDSEGFENLRLLSNFETFTSKLLQIVLVGQPELESKLKSPRLRQVADRVAVHCHINPLKWSESCKYVEHRLQCVGGSLDLFTAPALRLAIRRSQGIPRRINIVCHNALLFAYAREARTVSRSHVRTAVREREGHGLALAGSSIHMVHTSPKRWLRAWVVTPATMVLTLTALMLRWNGGFLWHEFAAHPGTAPSVDSISPSSPPFSATFDTFSHGGGSLTQDSAPAPVGDEPCPSEVPPAGTSTEANSDPDDAGRGTDEAQAVLASTGHTGDAADDPAVASPPPTPDSGLEHHEDAAPELPRASIENPPRFRLVHVAPGATLGSLTREVYGVLSPELLKRVRAANPQIVHMNHILAGDTLRFPQERASGDTAHD